MISRVFKLIGKHKRITIISLIIVVLGGYFGYQNLAKNEDEAQYATVAIEKGVLVVSMSGSGQVSVSEQIEP